MILDVVWTIRRLADAGAGWSSLADAFGLSKNKAVRKVIEHALTCDYRVHFLDFKRGTQRVINEPINNLDPGSPNEAEAEWGGLTGFSSRFGEAVRAAVNDQSGIQFVGRELRSLS